VDEFDTLDDTEDVTQDPVDTDDDVDAAGSEESNEAATADDGDQKRINDLMSKWQKAEAANKKLEERLAKLESQGRDDEANPQQWVNLMRQSTRDQIYESEPRLARYGIEPTAIEGNTPAEMRASMTNLVALIDRIETDASNRTLKKAGLTANQVGGRVEKGPSIPESDEDFEKLVAQAKGM